MSGTSSSGRKKKPTEAHKLAGSYRADRHGGALDAILAASIPIKPSYLGPEASKIWDAIIATLPAAAVSSLDTWALEQCAVAAALARWNAEYLQLDPSCEEAQKAFLKFSDKYEKLGGRFGLTPADRAKIKSGEAKPNDDPLAMLANLKAPCEN